MDFDPSEVLGKPLMAHLATSSPEGPRHSPVWFHWEDERAWLIGRARDSFIKRLRADPRCALGVVDFDPGLGILRHVGIRGVAQIEPMDGARLDRLLRRYLGLDPSAWNKWFQERVVAPLDVMVKIEPRSIVARDVSFFRTGPSLARPAPSGG